ncbi:MAG: triose-phosphate isomerase [Candidatus Omnitrophota bacterium]
MRKIIIAGNWKMYKTIDEAVMLVTGLKRQLSDIREVEIVVCPPYTALSSVSELLIDSNIALGAQDVYWQNDGAFTGEVSAQMLKDAGVAYIIVGHSERRKYFHESDENVNKKIHAVLSSGVTPICCIGETLEERESNKTIEVIKRQLEGAFSGIDESGATKIVLAYEPVWAIGTGKTATPQQAQEVHAFIRKWLSQNYNHQISQEITIQYGGSVKPSNIKELIEQQDIDGALVGGASLEVSSFSEIVKNALAVTKVN